MEFSFDARMAGSLKHCLATSGNYSIKYFAAYFYFLKQNFQYIMLYMIPTSACRYNDIYI